MGVIKGQFFRVKIGGQCVAMSKTCSLHTAAELSDTTTKDTEGNDKDQEVTSKSWDGSVNALVIEPDALENAIQGLDALFLVGQTVDIEFVQTNGANNRSTKSGGRKITGRAIINDCSAEFPDRADSTYTMQFAGKGALVPSTAPSISGAESLTATTNNQTSTYTASDGSAITVSVPAAATWLTASISGNTLTYKGSANAGAERSAVINLTTASGASLNVTVTQAGSAE